MCQRFVEESLLQERIFFPVQEHGSGIYLNFDIEGAGQGQHRVSENEIFSTPKTLHISVLHVDFKQNNIQITLTTLDFDFEKVVIHLNLVNLLNKISKNANFGHRLKQTEQSNIKINVNTSKIHQKNDFLKSQKIAEPQNRAI